MASNNAMQRPGNSRGLIGLLIGVLIAVPIGLVGGGAATFFAYRLFATPTPVAEVKGTPTKAPAEDRQEPAKKLDPPAPEKDKSKPKTDPPPKKEAPDKQSTPPADAKSAQELADTVLRHVNTYRKIAGLGTVQVDAELSKGCAAHAKYIALNPPNGPADAANVLKEDPAKPGFTALGQSAAQASMVLVGDPRVAVDGWMSRLNSRVMLLNQDLRGVGLGLERVEDGRWALVLDALRGGGEPIILYPVPGQDDVPLTFAGGPELPDVELAAGYPVTASFPQLRKITDVQAELHEEPAKRVEAWLFTPEKPAVEKRQRNTIMLIAKNPLRKQQTYRVQMSASVDGAPWSKSWSFTTEDDADSKGVWAKKAVDKVNACRKEAGLLPVVLEEKLSKGCALHARYLAVNLGHPATAGLDAHKEDLSLPGASQEGHKSGTASNINIGEHDPLAGIDAWMATLYHRVPILDPDLKAIGFGCARGRRLGWISVMDIKRGREPKPWQREVVYPSPDQTGVPLNFPIHGEVPDPIPDSPTRRAGFPVTAFFPTGMSLASSSMILTDSASNEIPVWFSSPEFPANPKYAKNQKDTVCAIAKEPLKPNTTYKVLLRGSQAGKGFEKTWKFTTGGAGPGSDQMSLQVVQRLNDYRAIAGVNAVTLDPPTSKGCQAHAEYLARNNGQKSRPWNDEDPKLPGYTPEGKQAAQRSSVYAKAALPTAQIDHHLGTAIFRTYLLDPNLRRIGFGCANDVGRGWQGVLDFNSGRGAPGAVIYPVRDQEGVPCAGSDRLPGQEGPPGFPITVTFPAPFKLLGGKGTLTDADGNPIDAVLTTPERPLNPAIPQRNTVALYPKTPLLPGRAYTVMISVVVDGQEWRRIWQFTTE